LFDCAVPTKVKLGFITTRVKLVDKLTHHALYIKGTPRIYIYQKPTITEFWPKAGSEGGGTLILITVTNLSTNFGGIFCKFSSNTEDKIVAASIRNINSLIECVSPSMTGETTLSVSIDNKKYFFGDQKYNFIPNPLSIT
jgi:hypothetical protein